KPLPKESEEPGEAVAGSRADAGAPLALHEAGGAVEETGPKLLESRLNELQQRFQLTDQELKVMGLIRGGHSKPRIAAKLMLSENTIRGYAKSLYAKLGVHSKEELLDLIGL
ncbi:MAG: helix-turn-helix transcriptional regulator, partial [Coriobacteriaceae bacterium]|nr:helix-turn-helix transcriptional regulator [Coriobacteriaceae bacterium]